MPTVLKSGQNVPLTRENPNLDELVLGFGWDVIQGAGPQIELVPSAIMTNDRSEALSDRHFVFFNQLDPAGATSYVEGPDIDQIEVSLAKIPSEVSRIVFIVYVNPDVRQPGTFKSVRSAYIRVADKNNTELTRFEVDLNNAHDVSAMLFGELYRHNGEWKFRALGQGYNTGIQGVASDFKVNL